jgi:ubiquinone/menaquinone biosynthesis C-methylase UbiE
LSLFKRNRKDHWERVYQKLSPGEVGWYQAYPKWSLKLIGNASIGTDLSIIDVGGGTSGLSEHLLDRGYRNLTVLDISGNSIDRAKSRLGEKSHEIKWVEADITSHEFKAQYDIWHDRAVFHFLTNTEDRRKYIAALNQALKPNGQLIMATFSLDAPPKCSGLPVVRYSPETLQKELGHNFNPVETALEKHVTPSGVLQDFIFCRFIKRA